MTDYVLICPKCHLVYKPDERIYVDPENVCPRCGASIHKDSEDEFWDSEE